MKYVSLLLKRCEARTTVKLTMAAGLIQRIRPSDQIWSIRELLRSPRYPGGGQR